MVNCSAGSRSLPRNTGVGSRGVLINLSAAVVLVGSDKARPGKAPVALGALPAVRTGAGQIRMADNPRSFSVPGTPVDCG